MFSIKTMRHWPIQRLTLRIIVYFYIDGQMNMNGKQENERDGERVSEKGRSIKHYLPALKRIQPDERKESKMTLSKRIRAM